MYKKNRCAFFLILVVCAHACSSAIAGDAEDEKIVYGDYAYTLANGQATIVACSGGQCGPDWDNEASGLQDRPGKEDKSATFPKFIDGVWRMVVPDRLDGYPVIAIGKIGLCENGIGDILLPEGLTSIDSWAFYMSQNTHAITIPDSVTFIGEYAFEDCFATLRVTEGSYAARYAEANGIPYTYDAEYKVFESGEWLYTLTDGLATIYGYGNNNVRDVIDLVIPDHLDGYLVTAIKGRTFPYSFERAYNLTSVILPDSLTFIGDYVFDGCDELTSVILPDSLTSIGGYAFKWCDELTSLTIPEGCTFIGEGAFEDCSNLTLTVTKRSYAAQYAEENGIPYVYSAK